MALIWATSTDELYKRLYEIAEIEGIKNVETFISCEADAVSGSDRGVAEGLGQKGLTYADRPDKKHVIVAVNEVRREDGIEQTTLHGYLGCPVKILETADFLESRRMEMDFQVAVITPGYRVSQQYL